jgi:NAD(P)-dependent dehydrogenase (short-subunit alcohol dehydrogenase family)
MNPVALITGASRGIGRGIALELAKIGYDLVINYAGNQAAAGESVAECAKCATSLGKSIRAVACRADIAVAADRAALIQFTRDNFRRLDLLVNNAGVAPSVRADILEATEESFDRLIGINVKGPYFLTQLAAKWMIEQLAAPEGRPKFKVQSPDASGKLLPLPPALSPPRGEGEDTFGRSRKIITISSISAYTASTNRGDYCIAKAALSMLTPLYAARLAEHGINVYEIRPGIIATDMTGPVKEKYDKLIAAGLTLIQRWGTPEDVGKAVSAIALDLLPFSTGEVLNVDGGFHVRTL